MKGKKELHSPSVLSPKLPVKPLKRRRMRLGTADPELEDTTLEILDALRGIPPTEAKNNARKPLPAIGSLENVEKTDVEFQNHVEFPRRPKKDFSRDISRLDIELGKSPGRTEETKMTLRPRRRREPTFLTSNTNGLIDRKRTDISDKSNWSNSDLKLNFPMDFIDNLSVYSDLSEDVARDSERCRRSNKNDDLIKIGEVPVLKAKAGRRSSRRPEPSKHQMTLGKGKTNPRSRFPEEDLDVPDSYRTSGSKVPAADDDNDDELLINLTETSPNRFENNSICSDLSKTDENHLRRRSRRIGRNDDESSVRIPLVENGFSDAASVFSDDFSETYDPTVISKQYRARNHEVFPTIGAVEETDATMQSGIFVLPQRHKKRSRRQSTEFQNQTQERSLFPNDVNFLTANCLRPDVKDNPAPDQTNPKQQRRRPRKYLPPLSENLASSKWGK